MLPAVVIRVFKSLVVSYRLVEIGSVAVQSIQFNSCSTLKIDHQLLNRICENE